jgi:hypothetical protein
MIKVYELYSYWITIYFILFLVIKKYIELPYWISPYPTIIFGSIGQLILTILSIINNLPFFFIIGVMLWKLSILYITLKYINRDYRPKTLLFNILIFIIYLIILAKNNTNIFKVYKIVIKDTSYFDNFINNRLKNIF